MAAADQRNPEAVRREIEFERERLASAVDSLRTAAKSSVSVPVVAAVALGAGFVLSGGIGATARLVFRRRREATRRARVGRFEVLDRDTDRRVIERPAVRPAAGGPPALPAA